MKPNLDPGGKIAKLRYLYTLAPKQSNGGFIWSDLTIIHLQI